MLDIGKDVKQLELLHIAGGTIKWCNHFGKQFGVVVFYKVKYTFITWPSFSTLRYLPEKNKNMCPSMDVHSRFIHNRLKLETS